MSEVNKNPRGAGRKPFSDPDTRRKQLAVNLAPEIIAAIKAALGLIRK
jgi:hypothetical protein